MPFRGSQSRGKILFEGEIKISWKNIQPGMRPGERMVPGDPAGQERTKIYISLISCKPFKKTNLPQYDANTR